MMISGIIPYLCYRLGMGTLPMLSLMAGEIAVFCLSNHIVIVPVPFGVGTNGFQEIYDRCKRRPKRAYNPIVSYTGTITTLVELVPLANNQTYDSGKFTLGWAAKALARLKASKIDGRAVINP